MPKKVTTTKKEVSTNKKSAIVDHGFKGDYVLTIGRRKTAVAQVRFYSKGGGKMFVNGLELGKYFPVVKAELAIQPLKAASLNESVDLSILVKGGGVNAQAEAIRHGLARALLALDVENKGMLRAKSWLTRDSRKVERKKPGLKKARRAPQWSKR